MMNWVSKKEVLKKEEKMRKKVELKMKRMKKMKNALEGIMKVDITMKEERQESR